MKSIERTCQKCKTEITEVPLLMCGHFICPDCYVHLKMEKCCECPICHRKLKRKVTSR